MVYIIIIYYTVGTDYVSGFVSSIAFSNFESMRLVLLHVAAAFWLEKDEFKYAYHILSKILDSKNNSKWECPEIFSH